LYDYQIYHNFMISVSESQRYFSDIIFTVKCR